MLGDILYAVLTMPFRIPMAWWHQSWRKRSTEPQQESVSSSIPLGETTDPHASSTTSVDRHLQIDYFSSKTASKPTASSLAKTRSVAPQKPPKPLQAPRPARNPTSARPPRGSFRAQRPTASRLKSTDRTINQAKVGSLQAKAVQQHDLSKANPSHEIWNPPPSSYADSEEEDPPRPSTNSTDEVNPASLADTTVIPMSESHVDEWRKYPPFPSAYPPTPIISNIRPMPAGDSSGTGVQMPFPSIPEDLQPQDFRESLLQSRRSPDPSLHESLSDGEAAPGIPNIRVSRDSDAEMGSVTYSSGDEDAFNVTLETPRPQRAESRSPTPNENHDHVSDAESSTSSLPSRSTTLNTADCGSSLRTRTTSGSSSSSSLSNSSSAAGSKRPFPVVKTASVPSKVHDDDNGSQRGQSTIRARGSRQRHQPSAYMLKMSQQQVINSMKFAQSSGDESEVPVDQTGIDTTSVGASELLPPRGAKRRRVMVAPKGAIRPPRPPSHVAGAKTDGDAKVQKTRSLDGPPEHGMASPSSSLRPPARGRRSNSSQSSQSVPKAADNSRSAAAGPRQTRSRTAAQLK
ncbi:hypothetical protein HGRIS_010069 [Hohenbuehelia grisea]